MATLASRTGGPPRDSFMSYVMWNAPEASVYRHGQDGASLTFPGSFSEAEGVLTFSDHPAERLFILLLKRSAALEAVINDRLRPICDQPLSLDAPAAVEHLDAAVQLLRALRAEMRSFMQRPEFTPDFFLSVLRQYACPWGMEDVYAPPSGAHDHHFTIRDLLLGIDIPGYADHLDHLFNVLDDAARREVVAAQMTTSVAVRLRQHFELDTEDGFAGLDPERIQGLVGAHPWLSSYYQLYRANGDVGATHWAMIYKYIVAPTRERSIDGPVVSNSFGTSGMSFDTLRAYVAARNNHVLWPLRDAFKGEASRRAVTTA